MNESILSRLSRHVASAYPVSAATIPGFGQKELINAIINAAETAS